LRAGEQHRDVIGVAGGRCVGVRVDPVFGGGQVGRLVPRQFERASGEVDELIAIHATYLIIFTYSGTFKACRP
jgi:hypothetical protein